MTQPFLLTDDPLPNGTLIEASAGTGKTYSVAAIVTQAIAIDEDLRIGSVLVTTYTRNAAAELKNRIRGRMVATALLLRGKEAPGHTPDALDAKLLLDEAERPAKARRLERAVAEFDTAAIGTIHAICARVLRLAGIAAADTGEEELRDRVVEEVVNDAVVVEAAGKAGIAPSAQRPRLWDEKSLRELVIQRLGDPFLKSWFDEADCTADEKELLTAAVALVEDCVRRVQERMRATPSFDDLLRRAWEEVKKDGATSFREQLRQKYQLAIVDEAQDTSRLQWEFLHELFPPSGPRPLLAVGDPKQAIYGFRGADVNAYLRFSQRGVAADGAGLPRRTLTENHRSDGDLLAGLNTAMQAAEFGPGIIYQHVDAAKGREGRRIVGLRPVEFLDVGETPMPLAAVRKVHELVTVGQFDSTNLRSIKPGEICVLVRANAVGREIEKQLVSLRIPAVSSGTASVMHGQMADDVRIMLEAMERPSDLGRTRRAAATAFFGKSLADVGTLGESTEQAIQEKIASLHATLQRRGIAALAADIMADTAMAGRLATGMGGERRIVDFAHVVELLHDASGGAGGHARVMLERFTDLAAKDEKGELVSRRVESDKDAVTIMSVHGAKGLEFPCVVVVDAWKPKELSRFQKPAIFYAGDERRLDVGHAVADIKTATASKQAALAAENEELRRLIYVAVTRPKHHISILRLGEWNDTLLAAVMPGAPETPGAGDGHDERSTEPVLRMIASLPEAREWTSAEPTSSTTVGGLAPMPAKVEQTYRRTSFSGITAEAARVAGNEHSPLGRGHDEEVSGTAAADAESAALEGSPGEPAAQSTGAPEAARASVDSFTIADLPAGTAFGSAVHEIFERIEIVPGTDATTLDMAIRDVVGDVATSRSLRPHHAALADMLATAMQTPFGGPAGMPFRDLRFADFVTTDRLSEMDFEMTLAGFDKGVVASDVGRVLKKCLPAGDPLAAYAEVLAGRTFNVPLAGLINGSIDAVLRLPGRAADDPRLVIADYKTNKLHGRDDAQPLAAYAPGKLVAAMAEHHYPLQALVYGTAIYRMLRWRLGRRKPADWDPGECIVGVVYGFIRGMKGHGTPVDPAGHRYGVFAWQPPVAVWSRLSDLFNGDREGVRA
jgi:exodeoxyribonuclease V beta subunit